MKILDRYILVQFLKNFISSFSILMLIFIFQTIWIYIDEFAGKGIDIVIIGKFLFYFSPSLTTKVVPLTVLLASIMTYGNFAENYEFAAMKSSGYSLQRTMRPLIFFMFFLAITMFFISNNVIPLAEQNVWNLRKNITKAKPAFAITEGEFNYIENINMNIRVEDKYGENDRFLKNVTIHKENASRINTTVIKAKEGEFISDKDTKFIQLVLKDGNYYEEQSTKPINSYKRPHVKANFETHTIFIDLSKIDEIDLNNKSKTYTYKMLTIRGLNKNLDSLYEDNLKAYQRLDNRLQQRSGISYSHSREGIVLTKDSISFTGDIMDFFEDFKKDKIYQRAGNTIQSLLGIINSNKYDFFRRTKLFNLHILALHKKYALPLACFILFFIGAPIGAIIRKGGLGLPMVLAILLFLTYFFIDLFAGNFSEDGSIDPLIGSWLSTIIMLPVGVYLTKRATSDKGFVDIEIIGFWFKKIRTKFKKP